MGDEYAGREQTQLKHMVLERYLVAWGMKLAHTSQAKRGERLWFVDCFAGPWRSEDERREDTSAAIAFKKLHEVREATNANVGAIFVEKDPGRFDELRQFIEEEAGHVYTEAIPDTFTKAAPRIQRVLGTEAAFVFVDPTGIKGADMQAIASIANRQRRDVMVNFMFDFLNRFKGEATREKSRQWLVDNYASFFGGEDVARLAKMDEDELVGEYRRSLKAKCGFQFCLSLAVPNPIARRTYFHLVLGAHNPAAVKLFRDTEKKVIGNEAETVLGQAQARKTLNATGQHDLLGGRGAPNLEFDRLRQADIDQLEQRVLRRLHSGTAAFGDIWPQLLEELHVKHSDLTRAVMNLVRAGKVDLPNLPAGKRSPRDKTLLQPTRSGQQG